ncbi:MAG: hypothetical protein D6732_28280 [Methanobacteriota archaeon]|nr:MAG: hypothetical protein D6732_28280 [Euryarchaeota archaeon]
MAKIEDEISALRKEIATMKNELSQINFNVLRLISEIGKIQPGVASELGVESVGAATAIDLGPIQERLDELASKLITRDEINNLAEKIEMLSSERIKEAQETIARVTTLFQNGLEMVKLEATLSDVKSLLEETVLKE